MDTLRVKLRVSNCEHSERFEEFELAVYPAELFSRIFRTRLERLGIGVSRKMLVRGLEESVVEREFAAIQISVEGRSAFDNVVMAEDEEAELLGSHSLDAFGLAVDPIEKRLVPTIMPAFAVRKWHEPWLEAKS